MKKILFAMGCDEPENYIKTKLKDDCQIVGSVGYREAVISKVQQLKPDILILREALPGSISLDNLIYNLRTRYEYCRIILIAGKHTPGDQFLKNVISRGVYDIVYGSSVSLKDVVNYIHKPSTYNDVVELQGMEVEDLHIENSKGPELVAMIESVNNNKDEIDVSSNVKSDVSYSIYEDYIPNTYTGAYVSNISYEQQNVCYQPSVNVYQAVDTSYYPQNKVLYSQQNIVNTNYDIMPGSYRPVNGGKIIAFTGVRQGIGCTSVLLNTASYLSSIGKRVLVIDAVFDDPYIFSYLDIPNIPCGMEGVFNNYMNGRCGTISFYSFNRDLAARQINDDTRKRLSKITDNISYTMFNVVPNEEATDYFEGVIYDSSRYYDYILFDIDLSSGNRCISEILRIADKIVTINTNSSVEMSITEGYIRLYEQCGYRQKMISVLNKSVKESYFNVAAVSNYYNVSNVIEIPEDYKGFVKYQDESLIYYPYAKNRIKKAYAFLASLL